MERWLIAGKGLRLQFFGELCALAGLLAVAVGRLVAKAAPWGLMFLAILGACGSLVGAILVVAGLHGMGKADEGYGVAFTAMLGKGAAVILAALLRGTVGGRVADVAKLIFEVMRVYFVCTPTAELLEEKGEETLARQSRGVWRLHGGCTLLALAGAGLTWLPAVRGVGYWVMLLAQVGSIGAVFAYARVLFRSSRALAG